MRIQNGKWVRIRHNNVNIDGKVISADHYGPRDGWYIELLKRDGDYRYWKQGQDGGTLLAVAESEEELEVSTLHINIPSGFN